MGWCGGTDVFDDVMKEILKTKPLNTRLVKTLINALENHDWDCQSDSRYFDKREVRQVFEELHPDWFADGP